MGHLTFVSKRLSAVGSKSILVPRGGAPFGQHQESRPLATSGLHSGQTTGHARDFSTSGDPSGHFPAMECSNKIHRLQHVTERTVRQFANETLLGIFLFVDKSLP